MNETIYNTDGTLHKEVITLNDADGGVWKVCKRTATMIFLERVDGGNPYEWRLPIGRFVTLLMNKYFVIK